MEKSAYRALARVVSALLVRHGHAWGGRDLVASLATNLACNDFGSEAIGRMLDPMLIDAAETKATPCCRARNSPWS